MWLFFFFDEPSSSTCRSFGASGVIFVNSICYFIPKHNSVKQQDQDGCVNNRSSRYTRNLSGVKAIAKLLQRLSSPRAQLVACYPQSLLRCFREIRATLCKPTTASLQ